MIDRFRVLLEGEIQALRPDACLAGSSRAMDRMLEMAECFPPVLALLIEPWLARLDGDQSLLLDIEDGVRVHLYARILDDMLDEGLPAQKAVLLTAQTLLWKAVAGISLRHPNLQHKVIDLIRITVDSVQQEDQTGDICYWGPKNHHLLLIPMLLSENGPDYQACEAGLSSLLTMLQAAEERGQGRFNSHATLASFYQSFDTHLDTARLESLATNGWRGAADRIVLEAREALL